MTAAAVLVRWETRMADQIYFRRYGSTSNDSIFGNGQAEFIYGFAGDDTLYGNAGNDRLFGGDGADRLYGGLDADVLYGEGGNDLLDGGAGNDRIEGGMGDDRIRGGAGDDQLEGGEGNDTIIGDAGSDRLSGGLGSDNFIWRAHGNDGSSSHDEIMDFRVGEDHLIFEGLGIDSLDDLTVTHRGGAYAATQLSFEGYKGETQTITLWGVDASELLSSDSALFA